MTLLRLSLTTATLALALAACKPAEAPQPSTPSQSDPTAPSAPATPEADNAATQPSSPQITDKAGVVIDSKALAGDFDGNASKLVIKADGGYTQTLNAGGAQLSSNGAWSAAGPGVLLLVPQDKAAQQVRFDVVSADELRSQDGTYTFKRLR